VTEPVADEFERRFVVATAKLKVGDPLDRRTQIGPLARQDLREALHKQVQSSVEEGAKVRTGGSIKNGRGFFYEPTVLSGVRPGMLACDEETFGPVAAFFRVRDADEAVQFANRSEYGLSSTLWTQDLRRARELARRIEAGSVFVNSVSASDPRIPIGGVKRSGYGRELSYFGLREFVNIQTVWLSARNS
jgi:succinate-semialdehyde dehydrogenase/glutarate-semialdehyde dehydrogenase